MGYAQTTTGVTSTGPLATLSFTTPICAQYSIQVVGGSNLDIGIETSLDGINFSGSEVQWLSSAGWSSGQIIGSRIVEYVPIAAIRANVYSITGTVTVSIAAAPLYSE